MSHVLAALMPISIHALREEGDDMSNCKRWKAAVFLSTPSARRATHQMLRPMLTKRYFYPRPPRGGRQPLFQICGLHPAISIHALREEGDMLSHAGRLWVFISIHALREEGDMARRAAPAGAFDFYPRPPRGGRLKLVHDGSATTVFLSTPSARRATPGDMPGA